MSTPEEILRKAYAQQRMPTHKRSEATAAASYGTKFDMNSYEGLREQRQAIIDDCRVDNKHIKNCHERKAEKIQEEIKSLDNEISEKDIMEMDKKLDAENGEFVGDNKIRVNNWVLTYWPKEPMTLATRDDKVQFYITQLEICPSTGRLHGHMYIEFRVKVSCKMIKTIFGDNTINCQVRKSTQARAIAYCSKQATRLEGCNPVMYGEVKHAGPRNDLDSKASMVMEIGRAHV